MNDINEQKSVKHFEKSFEVTRHCRNEAIGYACVGTEVKAVKLLCHCFVADI